MLLPQQYAIIFFEASYVVLLRAAEMLVELRSRCLPSRPLASLGWSTLLRPDSQLIHLSSVHDLVDGVLVLSIHLTLNDLAHPLALGLLLLLLGVLVLEDQLSRAACSPLASGSALAELAWQLCLNLLVCRA